MQLVFQFKFWLRFDRGSNFPQIMQGLAQMYHQSFTPDPGFAYRNHGTCRHPLGFVV